MPEPEFDPYLKWLGIRDPERPINHYRLLGLDLFESDPEVISMAADRQMTHIRTYQSGPRGKLSQQILNELATARRCLLVPDQKRAYDQQLRDQDTRSNDDQRPSIVGTNRVAPRDLRPPMAKPIASSVPSVASEKSGPKSSLDDFSAPVISVGTGKSLPSDVIGVRADENIRVKRKKKERGNFVISLIGWLTGGLAGLGAGALILTYVLPPVENVEQGNELGLVVDQNPNVRPSKNQDVGIDGKEPELTNGMKANINPPERNGNAKPTGNSIAKLPSVNDPEYPWSLANLNQYPQPGADAIKLIKLTQAAADPDRRYRFELSNQRVGNKDFENVPAAGGVVIGFVVSRTDGGAIKSLRPIYLNSGGAFLGKAVVGSGKKSYVLVARPGYAVGEIEYSKLSPMAGFQLTYRKIGADRLNRSDSYTSKWFGYQNGGPVAKPANSQSLPIIGIYGRFAEDQYIASIGLIGLASGVADSHPIASTESGNGEPAKPLPSFFPDKQPATDDNALTVKPPPMENGSPAPVRKITKPEPPNSKEIKAAEKALLELYADQIRRADTPTKLQHLAKLLLNDARSSPEQGATIYVMLSESIRVATNIGDAKTAVDAISELDSRFEIEYWELVKDTIDNAAKNPSPLTAADFKWIVDDLINSAIGDQQFDEADWVVGRAVKMARRAGDNAIEDGYQQQRKRIKALSDLAEANASAVATLKTNPDDPVANLQRGDYLFIVANQLDGAMNHWQKCDDDQINQVVQMKKAHHPTDVNSELALADAWESAGRSNRTLRDRKCLERALALYQLASSKMSGLEQRKIDIKIQSLEDSLEN